MKWMLIMVLFCLACDGDNDSDDCKGLPNTGAPCPTVIDPVCGCNNVTYNNYCLAETAGVKSWTDGECN